MPSYPTYNVNPTPTAGSGTIFGRVPGPTPLPSPATDLGAQLPSLQGVNALVSRTLLDKLGGNISPATQNALQDAAARYGFSIGQPGMTPLAYHNLFANVAGFAENQAEQGLRDYSSIIPTISGTQTVSPALQAQIASENAVSAAAPDPEKAQSYAQSLFANYLQGMRGPGGGTRGAPSPASGRSITPGVISSGFGTPDQIYSSLAPGEYYGGELLNAPPTVTVPGGDLQAGGPGIGSGTIYSGPQISDEQLNQFFADMAEG